MKISIPDDSPLIRRFPELGLLDNPGDREKAWEAAWETEGVWTTRILMVVLTLSGAILSGAVAAYVRTKSWGWVWVWIKPCCVMAPLMLSSILAMWLRRRQIERALRHQLIKLGRLVCIKCGYNLTGNVSGTCPECGTPVPGRAAEAAGAVPPPEENEQR